MQEAQVPSLVGMDLPEDDSPSCILALQNAGSRSLWAAQSVVTRVRQLSVKCATTQCKHTSEIKEQAAEICCCSVHVVVRLFTAYELWHTELLLLEKVLGKKPFHASLSVAHGCYEALEYKHLLISTSVDPLVFFFCSPLSLHIFTVLVSSEFPSFSRTPVIDLYF